MHSLRPNSALGRIFQILTVLYEIQTNDFSVACKNCGKYLTNPFMKVWVCVR